MYLSCAGLTTGVYNYINLNLTRYIPPPPSSLYLKAHLKDPQVRQREGGKEREKERERERERDPPQCVNYSEAPCELIQNAKAQKLRGNLHYNTTGLHP